MQCDVCLLNIHFIINHIQNLLLAYYSFGDKKVNSKQNNKQTKQKQSVKKSSTTFTHPEMIDLMQVLEHYSRQSTLSLF